MYPAHPQSNQTFLELDVISKDPLQKETYQEQDVTQMSNYKNYVYRAQTSKHWKEAEFEGFRLPAQGQSKPYCMKWVSWGCDNTKQHPNGKHYAEHENKTCKVANCPKCFESWINRQANRSTRRFSKYLEDKDFNFRHIILSPPQDQAKKNVLSSIKKMVKPCPKSCKYQNLCCNISSLQVPRSKEVHALCFTSFSSSSIWQNNKHY